VTYCVNIIENEKRRISKIGKEVEEIICSEKSTGLSEKMLNKLRDITNLKNCEYAQEKSDSEINPVEETINDIIFPDEGNKEFFTVENKELSSAELNNKEVDEMFKRASVICDEEKKYEEKKDDIMLESKEDVKEKEGINKEITKIERNPDKSEALPLEKSNLNEEESKVVEMPSIDNFIPINISKSLEEILLFLKETCPIKFVVFCIFKF